VKIPFVDLEAQYKSIKKEVDTAISKIIENTAFIQGAVVKNFETSFAEILGAKHCIAVANGTDALVISLKSLDIGSGDEVIVPANSFIASSEAVTATGAKVVFVDNHPKTYNIDTSLIEEKVNPKTKAIIVVHLYGQTADMDSLLEVANKHNLFVIEDSAQAHLAEYKTENGEWKKAGTIGNLSTFSFYPGKNLGAYGDAGAIVTNDGVLAKKARMYANHGRISKYDHEFEGINSRMDGIQGAVLNVKLKYLPGWTEKRRKAADYYLGGLKGIQEIKLPFFDSKNKPVWHLFVIRTNKRDALLEFLMGKGISVGIHYPISLPNLKAYKYLKHIESDFPIASDYQNKLLSLPIFPEITKEEQDYVISCIIEFFER
jgi:dTDP-4-amino-4,6-dideoxygalactose transaminase